MIETERLRLHAFRPADLKALQALHADAENLRWRDTCYVIDWLGIHTVEAPLRKESKPSAPLGKRTGFRLEGGPTRDRWWVRGKWHSVMLYGRVAGEEK
jgi:RimJ/RimL family protein N-acetyltransferase